MNRYSSETYQEINERDRERVQRILAGDQNAFAEIVTDYERSVFNIAYRMLGEAREAEDAAQETFLRAYRNLGNYDQTRSFRAWLLSIASHYCIDLIRKRRLNWLSLDDLLPSQWTAVATDEGPEDSVVFTERQSEVQELLWELNPEERAIIILRYWNDMSYTDIAEVMHISVGAVKSRLFRARQAMSRQMHLANVPGLIPVV